MESSYSRWFYLLRIWKVSSSRFSSPWSWFRPWFKVSRTRKATQRLEKVHCLFIYLHARGVTVLELRTLTHCLFLTCRSVVVKQWCQNGWFQSPDNCSLFFVAKDICPLFLRKTLKYFFLLVFQYKFSLNFFSSGIYEWKRQPEHLVLCFFDPSWHIFMTEAFNSIRQLAQLCPRRGKYPRAPSIGWINCQSKRDSFLIVSRWNIMKNDTFCVF